MATGHVVSILYICTAVQGWQQLLWTLSGNRTGLFNIKAAHGDEKSLFIHKKLQGEIFVFSLDLVYAKSTQVEKMPKTSLCWGVCMAGCAGDLVALPAATCRKGWRKGWVSQQTKEEPEH